MQFIEICQSERDHLLRIIASIFTIFLVGYSLFVLHLFADVTEPLLVEVDQIYHLACPASPIFYKYNPVKVGFLFYFSSVTVRLLVDFIFIAHSFYALPQIRSYCPIASIWLTQYLM